MKLKLLVLSLLASGSIMAENVQPLDCSTTAHANAAVGNHASQTLLSGYGAYNIINTSTQARTYYIDMSLCVNNFNCKNWHNQVTVQPGKQYGQNINLQNYVSLSAGHWEVEYTTSVSGAETSNAKSINWADVS